MSRTLIYRENKYFKVDISQLPSKARTPAVINSLYVTLHDEFLDAQYNPKYMSMNLITRMKAVNDFARKWLTDKGFM